MLHMDICYQAFREMRATLRHRPFVASNSLGWSTLADLCDSHHTVPAVTNPFIMTRGYDFDKLTSYGGFVGLLEPAAIFRVRSSIQWQCPHAWGNLHAWYLRLLYLVRGSQFSQ